MGDFNYKFIKFPGALIGVVSYAIKLRRNFLLSPLAENASDST